MEHLTLQNYKSFIGNSSVTYPYLQTDKRTYLLSTGYLTYINNKVLDNSNDPYTQFYDKKLESKKFRYKVLFDSS